MKKVETERFQVKKPEEISFTGSPLPDNPPKKEEGSVRSSVRTPVRPSEQAEKPPERETPAPANTFTIEVPSQRRKIRHPFDIYEDQLDALKKIQIAEHEGSGNKKERTLGDMAREALDDFIKVEAKGLPNIQILRENDKGKV